MTTKAKKELLLYLHVPFCNSKCHFCDWVQEIPTGELRLTSGSSPRQKYIRALKRQIKRLGARLRSDYRVAIMYWGGGTASSLVETEISEIADALHAEFDLSGLEEATIESSPESLTENKLRLFRNVGFRRISIGVQAFDDVRLRRIGRSHSKEGAINAINLAKDSGFDDISIDLISGFPDETVDEFEESLCVSSDLPINHYTVYPYRPAHGTVMRGQMRRGAGGVLQLDEQLNAFAMAQKQLKRRGLNEYALGHFGSPQCFSDLAYFSLSMDWIGLGSGATSLLGGRYLSNQRGQLERYNNNSVCFDEDIPAASDEITSRLMYQSLTLWKGAETSLWEERLGFPFQEVVKQKNTTALLDFFRNRNYLIEDRRGFRLKPEVVGRAFIELQFVNAPSTSRSHGDAESLLGAY